MGQLYTNDMDFTKIYPNQRENGAADALIRFMQDVGIPSGLHSDNAMELSQGHVVEIARVPDTNDPI
jgi:hypothetical protein